MRWGTNGNLQWIERQIWKPWFAWRPVKIGHQWIWLETLERRQGYNLMTEDFYYEHRFPAASDTEGDV